MKKLIILMLALWQVPAIAQIRSASLTATGLTCSMCSKAIFKSLQKVAFIDHVEPNVEKSLFDIRFKEGANVELDEVRRAVENAGFFVGSMEIIATFNGEEIADGVHRSTAGSYFHFLDVPKRTLSGEQKLRIVDPGYVPAAKKKQYAKHAEDKCYETGKPAACCPKDFSTAKRIYHVTI